MSKKRYVDTKFWVDTYIVEKDPIEKLLFLYLLTNTLTNILGIYEISIRQIAFDTGIDKDMVINILKRFDTDGKVKYEDGWVALKNFTKHQLDNPKINAGIESLLKEAPIKLIKWVEINFDRLCIDYESLSHLNTNLNTNNNTNPNVITEIKFDYTKGVFEGITTEYLTELEKQYPNCNIDYEVKKMANWLIDNPGKKRQGKRGFINNWLEKENKNKPTKESENKYSEIKDNMPTLTEHLRKGE